MRNLFSKGLMAAAAVMMFASCSNEEGVNVSTADGKKTDVTIGLSVRGTKAAGADMNFDGKAEIKNIAVVPFVGTAVQKPIPFANITGQAEDGKVTSEIKTVQMVNTVNEFKVYGNLTDNQYEKVKNGVYGLTAADFALTAASQIGEEQCYNPHTQLYYFADATSFYRATTGSDWSHADWGTASTGNIGDAKFIKIDNVNYAVGVLAAAIKNGDATECFYTNGDATEGAMSAADAGVTISAVLVEGQKDFNENLIPTGEAKTIYVVADKAGAFVTESIDIVENASERGNVFSVVSPTSNGEAVNVNIEFNLPANKFLKTTTGKVIGSVDNATKFYLGLKLTKDAKHTNEVFAADYVTILNATVKNWGIASETPVTVTDAQIGVEFNTEWQQGNVYEVEI